MKKLAVAALLVLGLALIYRHFTAPAEEAGTPVDRAVTDPVSEPTESVSPPPDSDSSETAEASRANEPAPPPADSSESSPAAPVEAGLAPDPIPLLENESPPSEVGDDSINNPGETPLDSDGNSIDEPPRVLGDGEEAAPPPNEAQD